jgi:hypothetical protein
MSETITSKTVFWIFWRFGHQRFRHFSSGHFRFGHWGSGDLDFGHFFVHFALMPFPAFLCRTECVWKSQDCILSIHVDNGFSLCDRLGREIWQQPYQVSGPLGKSNLCGETLHRDIYMYIYVDVHVRSMDVDAVCMQYQKFRLNSSGKIAGLDRFRALWLFFSPVAGTGYQQIYFSTDLALISRRFSSIFTNVHTYYILLLDLLDHFYDCNTRAKPCQPVNTSCFFSHSKWCIFWAHWRLWIKGLCKGSDCFSYVEVYKIKYYYSSNCGLRASW